MRTNRLAWCLVGGATLALSAVIASAARSEHVSPTPLRPTRVLSGTTCTGLAADGWSAAFSDCSDDTIESWSARTGRHSVLASESCVSYCTKLVIGPFGAAYVSAYEGTHAGYRQVFLVLPGRHDSVPLTGRLYDYRFEPRGSGELGLQADGAVAVFNSWQKGEARLWRVRGTRAVQIAAGIDAADVADVEHGVIAVRRKDGAIALLRANGSLIKVLWAARAKDAQFVQLDGRRLVVQSGTTLEIYDTTTDRLLRRFAMRGSSKGFAPYLEDARDGFAVYVAGTGAGGVQRATAAHLLRLDTGNELLLRLGQTGDQFEPSARLTDAGLFYGDVSCKGDHQLDFVPLANLLDPSARSGGAECSETVVRDEDYPAWSPDGGRLLFVSQLPSAHAGEIDVVNGDGTNLRRIVGKATDAWPLVELGSAPRWSPDGRSVAFVCARYPDGACVVPATGGRVRQLVRGGFDPAWSPDGRLIAFETFGGLYVMNPDGSGKRLLSADISYANFSWSPDSRSIVFPAGKPDGLAVVDVSTGAVRRITSGKYDNEPIWSPDGTRIAFLDSDFNLSVVDPDGSQAMPIATDNASWQPAWSPDGRRLAFLTDNGIETIAVDGSNRKALARTDASGPLAWSPDGTHIAFVGKDFHVWVVNSDGTGMRPAHR